MPRSELSRTITKVRIENKNREHTVIFLLPRDRREKILFNTKWLQFDTVDQKGYHIFNQRKEIKYTEYGSKTESEFNLNKI